MCCWRIFIHFLQFLFENILVSCLWFILQGIRHVSCDNLDDEVVPRNWRTTFFFLNKAQEYLVRMLLLERHVENLLRTYIYILMKFYYNIIFIYFLEIKLILNIILFISYTGCWKWCFITKLKYYRIKWRQQNKLGRDL